MKLIFIIGKFDDPIAWKRQCNIHQALATASQIIIAKPNWFPIIPHSNTGPLYGMASERYFRTGSIELMLRCDAVFEQANAGDSNGSLDELAAANASSLPIYNLVAQLPNE